MSIKLLGNRVLIEVDRNEKKTASGVILAKEEEMGEYMTGKVFEVGEGKKNNNGELLPMCVKKDDVVTFQYGKAVQVDGKTYMMTLEDDIIMVI